jgi:hypothetical protein
MQTITYVANLKCYLFVPGYTDRGNPVTVSSPETRADSDSDDLLEEQQRNRSPILLEQYRLKKANVKSTVQVRLNSHRL